MVVRFTETDRRGLVCRCSRRSSARSTAQADTDPPAAARGKGVGSLEIRLVRLGGLLYIALVSAAVTLCCSWFGGSGASALDPARKVAEGARVVAVKTARAGALATRMIVSGTYRGSRKAVTWTGSHTWDGTTATLEMLDLIDRPVPPVILERLPDELLASLTHLDFVKPVEEPARLVITSRDSRWEGELFYRLERDASIDVALEGPLELIVVSLAALSAEELGQGNIGEVSYTIEVSEDKDELGEVTFETERATYLGLYGYPKWGLTQPGVFVIKALEGWHVYNLRGRYDGGDGFLLVSCYLPRYNTGSGN